jgi:spoIIIJ-associated protein
MSVDKRDFYGKEVPEAIKKACETLEVPQEQLEIEVIETGSMGIFGLIRKKAHIRAQVKSVVEESVEEIFNVEALKPQAPPSKENEQEDEVTEEPENSVEKITEKTEEATEVATEEVPEAAPEAATEEAPEAATEEAPEEVTEDTPQEASEESLLLVKDELLRIVELMGFPSTASVEAKGLSVQCVLSGEFEEKLTGPEGKTLDSLQYLMRKIVTKKVPERLKLTVDVGNFREKRQEELKVRAVELAAMVKEDGKTQVIPALNPSERRVIHMALQEDKEIRSRSVGDGLFKKILIFKPGKGNKGGRKRPQSRGRRGKNSQPKKPSEDS